MQLLAQPLHLHLGLPQLLPRLVQPAGIECKGRQFNRLKATQMRISFIVCNQTRETEWMHVYANLCSMKTTPFGEHPCPHPPPPPLTHLSRMSPSSCNARLASVEAASFSRSVRCSAALARRSFSIATSALLSRARRWATDPAVSAPLSDPDLRQYPVPQPGSC